MFIIDYSTINLVSTRKTNADILDETYYEYHGRYDDGESIVEEYENQEVVAL